MKIFTHKNCTLFKCEVDKLTKWYNTEIDWAINVRIVREGMQYHIRCVRSANCI